MTRTLAAILSLMLLIAQPWAIAAQSAQTNRPSQSAEQSLLVGGRSCDCQTRSEACGCCADLNASAAQSPREPLERPGHASAPTPACPCMPRGTDRPSNPPSTTAAVLTATAVKPTKDAKFSSKRRGSASAKLYSPDWLRTADWLRALNPGPAWTSQSWLAMAPWALPSAAPPLPPCEAQASGAIRQGEAFACSLRASATPLRVIQGHWLL